MEFLEVVDKRNRPFLVLSRNEAHRQRLFHRAVLILLFDPRHALFLQKRSMSKDLYPGRWDVSASGHVLVGESESDAARRELEEELGIETERLRFLAHLPASSDTAYEFVTLFCAETYLGHIRLHPEEVDDGMFVDQDELMCMVRDFPELLTPGLITIQEKGLIPFPAL